MSSIVDTLLDFLNRRPVVALAWCLLGLSSNDILSLLNYKTKKNLEKKLDHLFNEKTMHARASVYAYVHIVSMYGRE